MPGVRYSTSSSAAALCARTESLDKNPAAHEEVEADWFLQATLRFRCTSLTENRASASERGTHDIETGRPHAAKILVSILPNCAATNNLSGYCTLRPTRGANHARSEGGTRVFGHARSRIDQRHEALRV
jgi:hypothetical protein